jgi:hypothetical protein
MSDKPDPDQLKGPGGLTLRQAHELVKQSAERDRAQQALAGRQRDPRSRWQRFVRYVWDKGRGRG